MTFDEFNALESRETIVLVEAHPSKNVSGFTPQTTAAMATGQTLGTALSNSTSCRGLKFTALVDILVTALGRWKISGNSASHTLRLMEEDSSGVLSDLATVAVNLSGGSAGTYVYANLSSPVMLEAGHTYHIYSSETNGGDQWYDDDTLITLDSSIAQGWVSVSQTTCGGSSYTAGPGGSGHAFGPVSLKWAHTFSIAFPKMVGASLATGIAGGVPVTVEGVRQDGVDLAAGSSSTLSAGQWWWDSAAEVLWVRTTTGASPDAFLAIEVVVMIGFATKGIRLDNGVYYWGWLTSSVPNIVRQAADDVFGTLVTVGGEIAFANGHGWFNTIFAADGAWNWLNKRITLLYGGQNGSVVLPRSEFQAIGSALVESVFADDVQARASVKPIRRLTEKLIAPNLFTKDLYPHIGPDVEGKPIPIGYGRKVLKPYLVDSGADHSPTVDEDLYVIADANFQTLKQLDGVVAIKRTDGQITRTPLDPADYVFDATLCTIKITNAIYLAKDYEIELDVTGKPSGGTAITTFFGIGSDILKTFLGATDAQIVDSTSGETKELSVWLTERQRPIYSVLAGADENAASLARSVGGAVQETGDGKWYFRKFDQSFNGSTGITLTRADLVRLEGMFDPRSVFWKTVVFYNENLSTGDFPYQEATSRTTRYRAQTEDVLQIRTYLRSSADALAMAAQYMSLAGGLRGLFEIEERKTKLIKAVELDVLRLTYAPAMKGSGAFASEDLIIDRLEFSYAPKETIIAQIRQTASTVVVDSTSIIPILHWSGPTTGVQDMRANPTLSFTTPGTYTITVDADVVLLMRGVAGGAGGAGYSWVGGNPGNGGGGGGGGAANTTGEVVVLQEGVTYTLAVGAGGAGGIGVSNSNDGGDGANGGDTYFSVQGGTKYVWLEGGNHGHHPNDGSGGGVGGRNLVGVNGVSGGAAGRGAGAAGGPFPDGEDAAAGAPGGGGGGAGGNAGTGGDGGNSGEAGEAGVVDSYAGRGGTGAGVTVTGVSGTYGGGGGGAGAVPNDSTDAHKDGKNGHNGVAVFSFVSA